MEDLLGALEEVAGLERGTGADVRGELIEEDGVIFTVFYVGGKVRDTVGGIKLDISPKTPCRNVKLTSCATWHSSNGS